MSKFQVQYKNNSKTFTDTFEANSYQDVLGFFQNVVNAEVTEIREILYTSSYYPKDDGIYNKYLKIKLSTQNESSTIKIPKSRKNITTPFIYQMAKQYLKISGKIPTKIEIFL